jgi:threonine dehydrogenase-like Zn-dependent dehydrogenase
MRAAVFHGPHRVEAGDRPDASLREPTDAVVRVALACVCGTDLWFYAFAVTRPHSVSLNEILVRPTGQAL